MKNFLLAVILFGTIAGFSQSGTVEGQDINLPIITSPSPDVYNFKEYGDIPVSYYTGIPQISIPIYKISTRSGLTVPINLDYHAGGIRVDEVSGTQGLGWSLKTGGGLYINVNGVPDFNGGNSFPSDSISAQLQANGGYVDPLYNNGEPIYDYIRDIYEGNLNCQPDTYQFTIPGGGSSFYLDSNGVAHLLPAGNYKVDFPNLEITDGDGNITKFGFGDTTQKDPSGCKYTSFDDALNSSTRSYFIDSIITNLNENIDYSYRNITYSYITSKVETDYKIIQQATTGCNYIGDKNCNNLIQVTQKLITRIDFPGGHMIFNYSDESGFEIAGNSQRLDLPGAVALRKITVENNNDRSIAEYELNYNYFHSQGGTTNEFYRLKLVNLIKNGEEVFSFDYYEDKNLPQRLSFAQDFWGYYNGQDGNTTLIPEMVYSGQTLPGGNRQIGSLSDVRAYSLKKITYPTGGTSTFNYEQNDFYSFSHNSTEIIEEGFALGANEVTGITGSKTYNLSQEGEITDFKITIDNGCDNDDINQGLGQTSCIVKLRDANGDFYASYTASGDYNINYEETDWSQITLEMQVDDCNCVAEVSWKRSITSTAAENVKAAGLRIGSIINDPIYGNTITKSYSYVTPGSSNSSGHFHDYPQFYSTLVTPGKPDAEGYPTEQTCTYLIRQNSPFYALNTASGQSVGYRNVQEFISGNGKTQFSFSDYNDLALSYSLPVSPVTSYAWKRGLLTDKVVYKENGNLLQKIHNEYEFDNQFASNSSEYQGGDYLSIGISTSLIRLVRLAPTVAAPKIRYNINYLPTAWIKNVSSSTWNYLDNDSIFSETSKTYSDLDNLMPTITSINTGNKTQEVEIIYPGGVSSAGSLGIEDLSSLELAGIEKLKSKHRNTTPIQITSRVIDQSDLTIANSVKRNLFKEYNNIVQQSEVKTSKGISNLEDRIIYYDYDESGNPLELSKADGPHIVYLWGYNDQYPIAKIENTTASAVSGILGNLSAIDESDMVSINGLRTSLPNALITTYTYNPLVGVTNIRDPRGKDTQYFYDSFGRLENVKDDADKLLKEFKYHYQQ